MPVHCRMSFLALLATLLVTGFLEAADPIMPVSEVRAGMRGYGKTVFCGDKIERFDIEVLDVLHNNFPGQDLILIRCFGPVCERANVIAGMSGSPIYIDGRVIGALAYAWRFQKEPIAGVTPIEAMLSDSKRPLENPAPPLARLGASEGDFRRIETPVWVAGLHGSALNRLRDAFAPYGLVPQEGASGTSVPAAPPLTEAPFEPGSAIGVQLIRGDMDATAIGTVTYVDGARVLAFGHPFLNGGEQILPMTTAWIHGVLPSLMSSFKFGSPVHEAGALIRDCNTSILGEIGRHAPMIPVALTVKNGATGHEQSYTFEILRHPELSPMLLLTVLEGTMEVTQAGLGEATLAYRFEVEFEKYGPAIFEDVRAQTGTSTFPILNELFKIMTNSFEYVPIRSIRAEVTVRHESARAQIVAAWLSRREVNPGEPLRAFVRVRPFQRPEEVRELEIPLPGHLREGEYELQIRGASALAPELPAPQNFAEALAVLRARNASSGFGAEVVLPRLGLRLNGRAMPDLPNSVIGAWIPTLVDGAQLAQDTYRLVLPAPWVLDGSVHLDFRVKE